MVERCALPTVRGITVAGPAISGETLLLMIGPLIIVTVAAHAIGPQTGVLTVAVALAAIRRLVLSFEWKPSVIDGSTLPCGCRVTVAVFAIGGESLLLMVGLLILAEVAARAVRG